MFATLIWALGSDGMLARAINGHMLINMSSFITGLSAIPVLATRARA